MQKLLYARLYYSENPLKKVIMLMFEPYYKVNEYLSNIKDKALIYKKLKALPDKQSNTELKTVNWQDEYDKIEKENSEISIYKSISSYMMNIIIIIKRWIR